MGRDSWPLKINASHDMYLCFGPHSSPTDRRCIAMLRTTIASTSDFVIHFGCKTQANKKQMGGDGQTTFSLPYHSIAKQTDGLTHVTHATDLVNFLSKNCCNIRSREGTKLQPFCCHTIANGAYKPCTVHTLHTYMCMHATTRVTY